MKQGGMIYWSELYPRYEIWGTPETGNIRIPPDIKYQLIDLFFVPFGLQIGYLMEDHEEYDIKVEELPILLSSLETLETKHVVLNQWIQEAIVFLKKSISFGKPVSIVL